MSRCKIVTLPDGSAMRVQGDAAPADLQTLCDAVAARYDSECHADSNVNMPAIAQKMHGRPTYWCGLKHGHDGPHCWPADGSRAMWPQDIEDTTTTEGEHHA